MSEDVGSDISKTVSSILNESGLTYEMLSESSKVKKLYKFYPNDFKNMPFIWYHVCLEIEKTWLNLKNPTGKKKSMIDTGGFVAVRYAQMYDSISGKRIIPSDGRERNEWVYRNMIKPYDFLSTDDHLVLIRILRMKRHEYYCHRFGSDWEHRLQTRIYYEPHLNMLSSVKQNSELQHTLENSDMRKVLPDVLQEKMEENEKKEKYFEFQDGEDEKMDDFLSTLTKSGTEDTKILFNRKVFTKSDFEVYQNMFQRVRNIDAEQNDTKYQYVDPKSFLKNTSTFMHSEFLQINKDNNEENESNIRNNESNDQMIDTSNYLDMSNSDIKSKKQSFVAKTSDGRVCKKMIPHLPSATMRINMLSYLQISSLLSDNILRDLIVYQDRNENGVLVERVKTKDLEILGFQKRPFHA